jgi:alkanesulfonate monooxygenase SsuD/methylene tetrahydromethanopterin reductase-like flavin-dependent oxidoreductase (luciferase family)
MYRAFLDMAAYMDQHGFVALSLEEHHGAENGWSPSPLVMAGMVLARTSQLSVAITALLLPLHDPLRVAEDIAVLDLASAGRLSVVVGLGYRPSEYAAHGKDWSRRGQLMDSCVDAVLKAWTGEPFEHEGHTVRVTPRPVTQPHPNFLIGGTAKASARRAARFGLSLSTADHLPELEAYYYRCCEEYGVVGQCMMPPERVTMLHVASDPDKAWAQIGHHLLHEAATYASWQTADIRSVVHSHATTVDELRAEGIYQILSPEECVERAKSQGEAATFTLHPLCGGMPIDNGWESVQLLVDQVLPRLV